jgi:hypothetical protein
MKCLVDSLLVLLIAGTALGQGKPNDGFWWAGLSSEYKLGFVAGFAQSEASVQDLMAFQCIEEKAKQNLGHDGAKVCLESPEVARYDFSGIPLGQFADGVDTFYKDSRNKNLNILFALKFARDKLKGKSAEELERELKNFRDISAGK